MHSKPPVGYLGDIPRERLPRITLMTLLGYAQIGTNLRFRMMLLDAGSKHFMVVFSASKQPNTSFVAPVPPLSENLRTRSS